LHHLCWQADGPIESVMAQLDESGLTVKENEPQAAPNGGSAAFVKTEKTRGVMGSDVEARRGFELMVLGPLTCTWQQG